MRYRRGYSVKAPLHRVAELFRQASSLRALTPPMGPVKVRAPERPLETGDEIELRLWVGPVPVRWLARIEEMGPTGFVDRQVEGPFRSWVHRHRFEEGSDRTTRVEDEIAAELAPHPLWGPVGLAIWLTLPALFWYRAWRTRALLAD